MQVNVVLLMALGILPILPAGLVQADGAFVMAGEKGMMARWSMGCPKQADFDRYYELGHFQDDNAAAKNYAANHGCDWVRGGDEVAVEDVSGISATSCVRSSGKAACVWVPTGLVGKAGMTWATGVIKHQISRNARIFEVA